jgi:D-alanine-D-alanine ligase
VAGPESLAEVARTLEDSEEPVVFNLVEEFDDRPHDGVMVPALCESYGKGCTGGSTPCQVTALDKWQTKVLLRAAGLRCPQGVVIPVGRPVVRSALPRGPYIVKPLRADASEGIDIHSVVERAGPALARVVGAIHEQFRQPALVEQFVGRRELNVSLLERGGRVAVLPIAEINFADFPEDRPRVVGYAAKWVRESFDYTHTPVVVPARLPRRVAAEARRHALAAWHVVGCRDYARVDMRLDERLRPVILEVNPNPDVSRDAGFAAAVKATGLAYDDFVKAAVDNALSRRAAAAADADLMSCGAGAQPGARKPLLRGCVRRTSGADRKALLGLIAATKFFHDHELAIAREVLEEALAKGPNGHYQSFCYAVGARPVGWVCFGPTPCTEGTSDIYWLAVAGACQGRGVGRRLTEYAEQEIRRRGGRLAIVETAGRDAYLLTRGFYVRLGYKESARVPDFYAPRDDKIIYTKAL